MIPKRFEPMVFGFVLSGLMSLLVSGISILRASGLTPNFATTWAGAWLTAWLFAFPVVLVVAPVARRVVQKLLEPECEGDCWRG
jgi:p-aminobenzoyl-glutamate transporter AbgT